jgi:8-oxo-dGTP pyrophosphatase MutT (NUDIX family)
MRSTSPPWRLANRMDETRHVRLAGEWAVQFRIIFDYGLFETLAGSINADTIVATCHPNRSLDELDLTRSEGRRTFPIGPVDPARQRTQIDHLITRATAAGASIVILPELCVTEELALGLQEWVRRPDGPRLLVAGSYHHASSTDDLLPARRRNTAIGWVRGHDQPLTHDKYSPADRPVVEDVQPDGWPELRVYVTADGWHLAIVICRDLLNPQAVNALSEAGVNFLLVPAMSETLMPFGGPVAQLVGARQAIVAVANNPGDWSHEGDPVVLQPARALFGHPGLGQQSRLVATPDPSPGLALLALHSGAITWLPESTPHRAGHETSSLDSPPTSLPRPSWLSPLFARAQHSAPPIHRSPKAVPLRSAAVLVLLSDGPNGPRVVMTERAADLTDYPGQLVFPGGAVDPSDSDSVATALREAHEEIGLDVDSIEVIGLLTPLALPQSGFLVDPVLAWSAHPLMSRSINFAEVAAMHQVPLSDLAARPPRGHRQHHQQPATEGPGVPDLGNLGRMTETVIDQLVGMLAHDLTLSSHGCPEDGLTSKTLR